MELTTFLKDGMVENWDMFENFTDYIYKNALSAIPRDHPLLITEPPVSVALPKIVHNADQFFASG